MRKFLRRQLTQISAWIAVIALMLMQLHLYLLAKLFLVLILLLDDEDCRKWCAKMSPFVEDKLK